jgi:hypothetical protein
MPNHTYLDTIANAFNEAKAWRTTTLVLGAAVVFLTGALIFTAQNAPTVLVPHDFATNNARTKVATNGDFRGTSQEYLVNLALSDISLVTNFTPGTVATQYERFLNRTTESLYANQGSSLRDEAKSLAREGATQAFFPNERTRVSASGDKVEVSGTLIRWQGDKEVIRTQTTYVVSYAVFNKFYHIKSLLNQQDVREAEREAAKEARKNAAQ